MRCGFIFREAARSISNLTWGHDQIVAKSIVLWVWTHQAQNLDVDHPLRCTRHSFADYDESPPTHFYHLPRSQPHETPILARHRRRNVEKRSAEPCTAPGPHQCETSKIHWLAQNLGQCPRCGPVGDLYARL
ncbi:hypothetical protein HETIRDRAFT_330637 [Heterobasidion irregulare TC 32-1]|uniref:Uncharacterized protein n=1 Tax=Heterobasidion irregulare (strain TC 32-1) TaxID=747525 RepID=W4JR18_HETIT|nr:uncharacterized protein HETIRDRAFT_330637 [Heterobasidion irregulare TC 32-1]ETW75311.1 hypothetical protein HETIRDRAFT_330637 [Heterobasidion irregulare TC 32-1]